MRTLSLNARTAMFAQQSGEVGLWLLTITHPSLTDPILLSTDPTQRITTDPLVYGTVSRGNTHLYVGMEVTMPDEKDKAPPASQLIVSNIDRSIIPLVRSINSPPAVKMEFLLASDLATVELTIPALDIVNVTYDATQLTFDLSMNSMATEPFPSGSFNPAAFGGLFAG